MQNQSSVGQQLAFVPSLDRKDRIDIREIDEAKQSLPVHPSRVDHRTNIHGGIQRQSGALGPHLTGELGHSVLFHHRCAGKADAPSPTAGHRPRPTPSVP